MNKILLVDDDRDLNQLLSDYLTHEGFEVTSAFDGESALTMATQGTFSAIVLDLMMPIYNGLEVLERLRKTHLTPVLMLTAKDDVDDCVAGLELGADDYLIKPCEPREIVARIRAILRRVTCKEGAAKLEKIISGPLVLNMGKRDATWNEVEIALTGTEFSVLETLMRNPGKVISKDGMTEQALHRKLTPYDRSIDVHVSNIRKKLAAAGATKELIINVRGAGYMLTLQEEEQAQ